LKKILSENSEDKIIEYREAVKNFDEEIMKNELF
jgi:hypothetical protein